MLLISALHTQVQLQVTKYAFCLLSLLLLCARSSTEYSGKCLFATADSTLVAEINVNICYRSYVLVLSELRNNLNTKIPFPFCHFRFGKRRLEIHVLHSTIFFRSVKIYFIFATRRPPFWIYKLSPLYAKLLTRATVSGHSLEGAGVLLLKL